MNHYIKKCKECQTVMGQCRCPAENKFVEWAVCEKCSQKTDRVQEAREFDVVVADAILNLLTLREHALTMTPEQIVQFADHMADLMQELRAARPRRDERVAVTEAMVEVGIAAFEDGVPWRDEREQVRAILTAALEEL